MDKAKHLEADKSTFDKLLNKAINPEIKNKNMEIKKDEHTLKLKNYLKSTHQGELKIMNRILPCAVLENGQRVINQGSVFEAFERPARGQRARDKEIGLPSFIAAQNLIPYINDEVKEMITPILYKDKQGNTKKSFKAEIIPAICELYLKADKDNVLTPNQNRLAEISQIIVISLSKVGITALVDEATGYQLLRAKDALQQILDQYLNNEFSKWAKRFPDDFYINIFRLKGWKFTAENIRKGKRPGIVGSYTNDIVYERLAPGILEEIKKRNKDEQGNKKAKNHQFLTDHTGIPSLNAHLNGIIALMKASKTWEQFRKMLEDVYPKITDQLLLEFDKE